MRMDAKARYLANNGQMVCKKCGESREVHICHIKPISAFSNEDKIEDINGRNNLVALCPTHHSLFDKGIRSVDGNVKQKVLKYYGAKGI